MRYLHYLLAPVLITTMIAPSRLAALTEGVWFTGDREFRQNAAWAFGRTHDNDLASLTIECDRGTPYIDVTFVGRILLQTFDHDVSFILGSQVEQQSSRYDATVAEPGFRSVLTQSLYDNLVSQATVTFDARPHMLATFSLTGARAAIDQALTSCAQHTSTTPPSTSDAPTLTLAHVQAKILEVCPSGGTYGPTSLVQVDLDGDGFNDYLVDWSEISCPPMGRGGGFCGAALCTIDVYASSTYRPGRYPQSILGLNKQVFDSSHPIQLRVSTMKGPNEWRWTGSKLE